MRAQNKNDTLKSVGRRPSGRKAAGDHESIPRRRRQAVSEAKTLAELKKSGVAVLTVREEMRKNLVRHLEKGELA